MGCSSLDSSSSGGDESFDGGGVVSSGEFLLGRLDTGDNGDSEEVGIDSSVQIENLEDFLVGFLLVEESSMAFLPQEFTGSEEWFYT